MNRYGIELKYPAGPVTLSTCFVKFAKIMHFVQTVMKARATHCTHERSFKHVDVVGCSGDKLPPRDHVLQLRRSVRAKKISVTMLC